MYYRDIIPYVLYMVWEDIMYVSYTARDGADDSPGSIGLTYDSLSMLQLCMHVLIGACSLCLYVMVRSTVPRLYGRGLCMGHM